MDEKYEAILSLLEKVYHELTLTHGLYVTDRKDAIQEGDLFWQLDHSEIQNEIKRIITAP